MRPEAGSPHLTIAVIGTGTMGRGIAQIAAAAGCTVLMGDAKDGADEEARNSLAATFAMLAAKGKMTAAEAEAATARLKPTQPTSPDFAKCALVVEAIIEHLDAKRALFSALEDIVPEDCVLATNTSSLSVTAIAAGCKRPERVAGLHFFNPVPLMKVVEVVAGCRTRPDVVDFLSALVRRMGHGAVTTQDTPGFLVNHAGRGFGPEALRLMAEGVADPITIDRILTMQAGFRMGPFELLDLVGLDVTVSVMESIYHQYFQEPRYRPSHLAKARLEAGLLGRKSGQGFYSYVDGQIQRPVQPPPELAPQRGIWVSRAHPGAGGLLAQSLEGMGMRLDPVEAPGAESVCLVTPLGADTSTAAIEQGLDPERVIAIDPLFGFDHGFTAMTSPATRRDVLDSALCMLAQGGKPVWRINDSLGFVAQRMVAGIINIACDIAQQKIASPGDIDLAVKAGLGYPQGPLNWGDKLGAKRILEILETMHRLSGEPRFRPSPWLRRRAGLGLSLLKEEV